MLILMGSRRFVDLLPDQKTFWGVSVYLYVRLNQRIIRYLLSFVPLKQLSSLVVRRCIAISSKIVAMAKQKMFPFSDRPLPLVQAL